MIQVVAALIRKDNKILICRRPANKARALLWEFAGGKIEAGESPQTALIRECKEELSVDITVSDLFCELTYEYPDITIHLSVYNAEIINGVPILNEHVDMRWVTKQELEGFTFCPADIPVIEMLKNQKNKN